MASIAPSIPTGHDATRAPTRPATPGEERALLAAGAVLLVGLFADGWAHTNAVDELESFLTPWHGIIGLGLGLTGAVVLRTIAVRRSPGAGVRDGVPAGWGLALVGVLAFAVGFVGDGVWHTVFGIESDIDALLSPTHLLMAAAMLAVFTAPVRARDRAGTGIDARGLLGIAFSTLVVAFFALWGWTVQWGLGGDQFPEGTAAHQLGQTAGLAGPLLITGILVGAVAAVLRRGTPARGALGALVLGVPVAMAAIDEFDDIALLLAFVAGAIVLETVVHGLPAAPTWAPGAAWAAATWSLFWVLNTRAFGVGWEVELYPGSVLLCTGLAAAIGIVGRTPTPTASA